MVEHRAEEGKQGPGKLVQLMGLLWGGGVQWWGGGAGLLVAAPSCPSVRPL